MDERAWQRLVTIYSPLVYYWCRRVGLQADDAVDIGQEVFMAVAKNIHGFRHDGEGDTFRGWLRVITRNKVMDFRRQRAGLPEAEGGSSALNRLERLSVVEDPPTETQADSEKKLIFRAAIKGIAGEFSEVSWKAFWRVTVEGESAADVAASLGISRNSVYLAKSRLLKRLREEMDGLMTIPEVEPK